MSKVQNVTGVVVIGVKDKAGKTVDSILMSFERPIFVARDTITEPEVMLESIEELQKQKGYSCKQILSLLEDSVILKLRGEIASPLRTGGGKMSSVEESQIFAKNASDSAFISLCGEISPRKACEQYRETVETVGLTKDEADHIKNAGRVLIKELHTSIL